MSTVKSFKQANSRTTKHSLLFIVPMKKLKTLVDPFAIQAKEYSLSRPRYPNEVLLYIKSRVKTAFPEKDLFEFADLGCGSGQLTFDLISDASFFKSAVGVDVSEPQLQQAREKAKREEEAHGGKVSFVKGSALQTPLPSNSFDLVTYAQAFHWLDTSEALKEANRLLRPKGVIAICGYSVPMLLNEEQAQNEFRKYYVDVLGSELEFDPGNEKIKWDCDRRRLDTLFHTVTRQRIEWLVPNATVKSFIEYLETWSAYQKIKQQDPLKGIKSALKYDEDKDRKIDLVFPFFCLLGIKGSKT